MKETPKFYFALREDLKEEKQFLPTRAEPKATGWDVRAAQFDRKPLIIRPFEHFKIELGFRAFCLDGWWLSLKPRSSTFGKKFCHTLYGTIDETYEGIMMLAGQYIPDLSNSRSYMDASNLVIKWGEALGQLLPVKRKEMNVLEWSNDQYDEACKTRDGKRGAGGFGSTGA